MLTLFAGLLFFLSGIFLYSQAAPLPSGGTLPRHLISRSGALTEPGAGAPVEIATTFLQTIASGDRFVAR